MTLFSRFTSRRKLALLIIALVLLVLGEIAYRHFAEQGWSDVAGAPPYAQIDALATAPDGTIWFATQHGLSRLTPPAARTGTRRGWTTVPYPPHIRRAPAALAVDTEGRLWAAAVCGGLSMASKYNYAVLAIPVALSVLLDPRLWLPQQLKRIVACGTLFCLAFLLTSPYVLLDFRAAMENINFELEHYSTGHLGQTGASFPAYVHMLWKSNPLFLLLGVPGLGLALWRRKRVAVPATIFFGVYSILRGSVDL